MRVQRAGAVRIFGLCAVVVYAAFVMMDFVFGSRSFYSSCVKYGGILLCLGFALWVERAGFPFSRENARLLLWAMSFTVCADWFLLFPWVLGAGISYSIGVAFFCLAQLAHKCRMGKYSKKYKAAAIPFACLLCLRGLHFQPDIWGNLLIFYPVCLYAWLLLSNVRLSFQADWPAINRKMLSAGMLLFLCCDLCVGLYQLARRLPVLENTFFATAYMVNFSWVFYLPSQFLLVCSSLDFSHEE